MKTLLIVSAIFVSMTSSALAAQVSSSNTGRIHCALMDQDQKKDVAQSATASVSPAQSTQVAK